MLNEILHGKRIGRYIPIISLVRSYQRAWLRDDLVSGVVGGAIMIPVAMAYAEMAGVPTTRRASCCRTGSTREMLPEACCHARILRGCEIQIGSCRNDAVSAVSEFGVPLPRPAVSRLSHRPAGRYPTHSGG
jgi:hypothetical protein